MGYSIYWIRQNHHTDPLTEGYIGVSSNPSRRLRYHSHPTRNNNEVLYRAIQKGATQEILYEYDTKEEAYAKEIEMRPHERIGYNLIPGGDSKPPVQYGNTWYRFTGKQPRVSCIECRKVTAWHRLSTHYCLPQCARDGCLNRVKHFSRKHCSLSCGAKDRATVILERDAKGRIVRATNGNR